MTGPVVMFTNLYYEAGRMEMYDLKLERVTDTSYKFVRSAQVAITENMNFHNKTNAEIQNINIVGVM
ncbi:hypothetical protein [Enterococcus faecium]|uniref:hypothetical protein n=1 Tax=Enterococcus faecium TaxID=1352 RepID=UPI003CC5ACFE